RFRQCIVLDSACRVATAMRSVAPVFLIAATAWAQPSTTISDAACSANSPSSILCSWTTNTRANSQVQCGTQAGGPYSYATTVLHPVQAGKSAWWGVTSHSVAITGLPNNTSS